ncbi:nucleotidyltransferase family protein [bacterium]|nr:nucleotidyltransferase family protein [bacterium]
MKLTREYVLEQLEQHAEELRAFGVTRIGLFGSVARGEASEDSDLDFVIELKEYTSDAFFDTAFFLEDLFGCKVDIGTIRSIRPELKDQILSEAVYAETI